MMTMQRIIFFDGDCVICNGFANWIMLKFKPHFLYLSTLQSPTAKKYLQQSDLGLDSIIYLTDGITYKKSKAILKILNDLGGFYKYLSFFLQIVPVFISDVLYDLVAKNRYRVIGKTETCRLPTESEKIYFLKD